MTVRKRVKSPSEDQIDRFINDGGKTSLETIQNKSVQEEKELKFTLRISQNLMQQVDSLREERTGNISRNTWILEAIKQSIANLKKKKSTVF